MAINPPTGDDGLDSSVPPDGTSPVTQPDGTVQVKCPNNHPAGNGYVAVSQLGKAICVTGSEILVAVQPFQ